VDAECTRRSLPIGDLVVVEVPLRVWGWRIRTLVDRNAAKVTDEGPEKLGFNAL
jgi:hypothetical protein